MVGDQAVLPCSCKPQRGEQGEGPSACYIQWTVLADVVLEQHGSEKWQAEEFKGRVEVPEESLGTGNCSLIIRDVQIGDTGRYESFMVVDGEQSTKTKVFIQSVKLIVFDHKSRQSRAPGEDLVLDLHTTHSVRVIFHRKSSSESSVMWMREDKNSPRLEKHPQKEQLTIKNLSRSDEGTYKVLDEQGLVVSTVQLFVEDGSTALKVLQSMEEETLTGDAAKNSCSEILLFLSCLVTSLRFFHLL